MSKNAKCSNFLDAFNTAFRSMKMTFLTPKLFIAVLHLYTQTYNFCPNHSQMKRTLWTVTLFFLRWADLGQKKATWKYGAKL